MWANQYWITSSDICDLKSSLDWDAIVVTVPQRRFVFQDNRGNDIVLETDQKYYVLGKPYGVDMFKEFEHHMAEGATHIFVSDHSNIGGKTPEEVNADARIGWHGYLCFFNAQTDKKTEYQP